MFHYKNMNIFTNNKLNIDSYCKEININFYDEQFLKIKQNLTYFISRKNTRYKTD